jgi:hypothetical protein
MEMVRKREPAFSM